MRTHSKRPPLPTTADYVGASPVLSRGGVAVEGVDRADAIKMLRTGGYMDKLTVEATVFMQTDATNRNFVRFTLRALQRMAKSFVGMPFLRDHNQKDVLSCGGRIVGCELVPAGADGAGRALKQTLELVKPWAQEGVLDGTISTFSIGWAPNSADEPLCTVCDAPMFSLDCGHFPGDVVTLKSGATKTVEMLYTDADGVETSAVCVPAVRGTGIDGIRAALSAWRAEPDHKERPMFKQLAARLGVSEDADETAVLASLDREIEKERALRAAADGALADAVTKLAELETQLSAVRDAERNKTVARLVDDLRRKNGAEVDEAGKPVLGGTPSESVLLQLAAHSIAEAEKFVADHAQRIPVGVPMQSAPAPRETEAAAFTEGQRRMNAQLGLTEVDFRKHAPGASRGF